MFKVNNKDTIDHKAIGDVLVSLWTLTYFTPCYTAIANFEQVNADWEEISVEK